MKRKVNGRGYPYLVLTENDIDKDGMVKWEDIIQLLKNFKIETIGSISMEQDSVKNKIKILEIPKWFKDYGFRIKDIDGAVNLEEIHCFKGHDFPSLKNCDKLKKIVVYGDEMDLYNQYYSNKFDFYFGGCDSLEEIEFKNSEVGKKFWRKFLKASPEIIKLIDTKLFNDAEFAEECLHTMIAGYMEKYMIDSVYEKVKYDYKAAKKKTLDLLHKKIEIEKMKTLQKNSPKSERKFLL